MSRQRMPFYEADRVIGFTDIKDSTVMNTRLGDEGMSVVRHAHFTRARVLARQYRGKIIKTMGDGLLLVFDAPTYALDFMLALQENTGHELISVRAGIHLGIVRVEEEDVFGTAVNYAARVVGKANHHETWVTKEFKHYIDTYNAERHRELNWVRRVCRLKGFAGMQVLWAVTH